MHLALLPPRDATEAGATRPFATKPGRRPHGAAHGGPGARCCNPDTNPIASPSLLGINTRRGARRLKEAGFDDAIHSKVVSLRSSRHAA